MANAAETTGGRRLRLLPRAAHQQILVIGLLFLVLGGGVFVLGLTQLDGVRANLDRVDRQLAPATEHLTRAVNDFGASNVAFQAMLQSDDAAERGALLARTTAKQTDGTDQWNAFKPYADALPNTASLVESADYDLALLREEGATMLNAPTPELKDEFDRTVTRVNTELNGLLRRFTTASRAEVSQAAADADATRTSVIFVYGAVFLITLLATISAVLLTRRREQREALRDEERAEQIRRDELDTRLQRSLELSPSEDAAFTIVEAAMRRAIPVVPADLLIADSPRGHLRRVATTLDETSEATCGVTSPRECPATNRGATTTFAGNDALDSCPVRGSQGLAPAATTCVPVNVSGNATGVVCTTGAPGTPIDDSDLASIELVARKAGERLTLMRAFAKSENQARTDPLTGLFNRRTLDDLAAELADERRPYVVAYADLDHFKLVNDVYGHDAGDHALRLFARVLRDSIRPSDLPCRVGGEEFVVVLPDCRVPEAMHVLERIRARLAKTFDRAADGAPSDADGPRFTVSFGLSQPDDQRPFEVVLAEADAALLAAKADGRDRVVVAGGPADAVGEDAVTS